MIFTILKFGAVLGLNVGPDLTVAPPSQELWVWSLQDKGAFLFWLPKATSGEVPLCGVQTIVMLWPEMFNWILKDEKAAGSWLSALWQGIGGLAAQRRGGLPSVDHCLHPGARRKGMYEEGRRGQWGRVFYKLSARLSYIQCLPQELDSLRSQEATKTSFFNLPLLIKKKISLSHNQQSIFIFLMMLFHFHATI